MEKEEGFLASPGIASGPDPCLSPPGLLRLRWCRGPGALSWARQVPWPGSESESCEAIRLFGPGTESERVRRRDHQLDYRAVSGSDYWQRPDY